MFIQRIPTTGVRNGLGVLRVDRCIHPQEAEHSRSINYDATNSGPLREEGVEAGGLGFSEVMGIGGA